MKKCGIYEIRNLVNNKVYVGSSANIDQRWRRHRNKLRTGKHTSKHLQHAWNTYSEDNFKFSIIEGIDENHEDFKKYLLEREQFYIDKYNVCNPDFGYNICAHAGSPLGYKHTPEAIKKMKSVLRVRGN